MKWADRTLAAQPHYRLAMRIKVVCCVYLSRIEEARDWLQRLLELQPGLTIARFKISAANFPPELLALYVEALRKPGLPEE